MKKILILAGHYLPGHKDGGPLRTLVNLTDALCNEYEFYIACYDRDHGDTVPYSGIEYNKWNLVGNANVWYVPEGQFTKKTILLLVKDKDILYLTSFYEPYGYNALLLKKTGKLDIPIALASMGVFSDGALKQKLLKKRVFISLCKLFGLFKNITWSVTSELEAKDVKREIGSKATCVIAEDLPRTTIPGYTDKGTDINVAFLSRISPIKNLLYAINVLKLVKSNIIFNIYGPIEDESYYSKCKDALKQLPSNVEWIYHGDVEADLVQERLSNNDIFLFPTLGENYGHVIFEALSVGCIPIISDQTPWIEIVERKAGFVFPLDNINLFVNAVEVIAKMNSEERKSMALRCVDIAYEKVENCKKFTGYRVIFDRENLC